MKKIIKYTVVAVLVLPIADMSSGMNGGFIPLRETNSTNNLPTINNPTPWPNSMRNRYHIGGIPRYNNCPGIPRYRSFSSEEWKSLENSDKIFNESNVTKESQSSFDDTYDAPIDPTEKFVQIDEKNKCVHIDTSHKDENSLFYSMLYRASLFQFTLTEMEILDSFGLNNWTKAVKPGWTIHTKDGTTITVIGATEAQNRWRQSKLPELVQVVSEYKYPRNLKKKVGEKRAKLRESLPCQCPSPNYVFRPTGPNNQKANGNQEEIAYESTGYKYVKFNREKRIVRIENLPNYKRFNQTPEDIIVRNLYRLIRLGILQHFELDVEQMQRSPLPSILGLLIGEGWSIDFNGERIINVI